MLLPFEDGLVCVLYTVNTSIIKVPLAKAGPVEVKRLNNTHS